MISSTGLLINLTITGVVNKLGADLVLSSGVIPKKTRHLSTSHSDAVSGIPKDWTITTGKPQS